MTLATVMSYPILVFATFLVAVIGSAVYLKFASKYGPYATPNYRSLHQKVIPRGGGLAVAFATLLGYLVLSLQGDLVFAQMMVYGIGATAVVVMGVADDRLDIRARYRMPFQLLSAVWVCYWLGGLAPLNLGFTTVDLRMFGHVILVGILVWFYNLYNFIDGIDGMASSAAIFICVAMGVVLFDETQPLFTVILVMLAVSSAGFLMFNWSPARMFLGEAGSSVMSFILSAVFVESLWTDGANLWPWLIVGSFYFTDTTLTTGLRVLTVPGWYRPHRSHAYQNLARIWNSHRRVVLLVMAINVIWIIPLLCVALAYKSYAIGIAVLVYLPLAVFCMKYGPLFENK